MNIVAEKIAKIIDEKYGGNKSAFARDIGITPGFAQQLYTGAREPSERTLSDIVRVCGVDEVWLRTGVGEPFRAKSKRDMIDEYIGQLSEGKRSDIEQMLIELMAETTVEEWKAIAGFFARLADKMNKPGSK